MQMDFLIVLVLNEKLFFLGKYLKIGGGQVYGAAVISLGPKEMATLRKVVMLRKVVTLGCFTAYAS